jgi:hypothetical protein
MHILEDSDPDWWNDQVSVVALSIAEQHRNVVVCSVREIATNTPQ